MPSDDDTQDPLTDVQREYLQQMGSIIRLSELPDEVVMQQVIIDILVGVYKQGLELNTSELGEVLSTALVSLGGFHRSGSCAW